MVNKHTHTHTEGAYAEDLAAEVSSYRAAPPAAAEAVLTCKHAVGRMQGGAYVKEDGGW
jgi:hypothetical protein